MKPVLSDGQRPQVSTRPFDPVLPSSDHRARALLFHLAAMSPGLAPFFLSICPQQWSHLQSSERLYGLPVTGGESFQREGSMALCLPGSLVRRRILTLLVSIPGPPPRSCTQHVKGLYPTKDPWSEVHL